MRRRTNWAARAIVCREHLVLAALAVTEAAADVTAQQLAAYGRGVVAATDRLSAAYASGSLSEIETTARDLSAATQLPEPLEEPLANLTTYLGAVLHLRGRVRQLDEAATAAQDTSPNFPGPVAMEVARGSVVQTQTMRDFLVVLQVPELPPVPHQLPEPPPITRPDIHAAIERMREMHNPYADVDQELIVVSGPPGSGSTTAALNFLASLIRPDRGDIYINLGHADPPRPPGEILHELLVQTGTPAEHIPDSTDARAAWWRSRASGPLMLIDGAVTAGQVRPLLPGGGGVVVVTSRESLPGLLMDGARLLFHGTDNTDGR